MSLPRFMLDARTLQQSPVLLTGADARHCRSLRLQTDDLILVSDSEGNEFHARIVAWQKQGVEIKVGETSGRTVESTLTITLYQGFAKGSKLEWVLQKATELGVDRVVPLLSERSQMKPRENRDHREERWQEIVRQAARQSGRTRVPRLDSPQDFAQSLVEAEPAALRLLFYEQADNAEAALAHLPNRPACRSGSDRRADSRPGKWRWPGNTDSGSWDWAPEFCARKPQGSLP